MKINVSPAYVHGLGIMAALHGLAVYTGSVPAATKARHRKASKLARIARRAAR